MTEVKKPVIGFCGMTHLGIISAISSAVKGFKTICFDVNMERIAQIKSGQMPVLEPDLDQFYEDNRSRLVFTSDVSELKQCDVVYISGDIPTDDMGISNTTAISGLIEHIEPGLLGETVLVILSQVAPGFTRSKKRTLGSIYYQVETLIFGRAIERALYPERYIVGCEDPAKDLPYAYNVFLLAYDCPILLMRYESAELAKMSINMCLLASVGVANTMAEICESIGADWSEIMPALKLDKRIGAYSYITPGLGISGGNLERDMANVIKIADHKNTDSRIVKAWIANSGHRKNWPFEILQKNLLDNNQKARIAVLGIAYKENTNSIKNSPSLVLFNQLQEQDVIAFDPALPANVGGKWVKQALTAMDAIKEADCLVIMTPWPEFKNLDIQVVADKLRGNLVIDPYCVLDASMARNCGLDYKTLGVTL